jgi:hypothetical protein
MASLLLTRSTVKLKVISSLIKNELLKRERPLTDGPAKVPCTHGQMEPDFSE